MIAPTSKVVRPEETGEERPMTGRQAAELRRLCEEQGEVFDADLGREAADRRIATLRELRDF